MVQTQTETLNREKSSSSSGGRSLKFFKPSVAQSLPFKSVRASDAVGFRPRHRSECPCEAFLARSSGLAPVRQEKKAASGPCPLGLPDVPRPNPSASSVNRSLLVFVVWRKFLSPGAIGADSTLQLSRGREGENTARHSKRGTGWGPVSGSPRVVSKRPAEGKKFSLSPTTIYR